MSLRRLRADTGAHARVSRGVRAMHRGSIGVRGCGAHVIKAAIDGVPALLIRVECSAGLRDLGALRNAYGQTVVEETGVFEIEGASLLHQHAVRFAIASTDVVAARTSF